MDIDDHVLLLINKYKLKYLYIKYKYLSIIYSISRESYYWLLLYFSILITNKPELIYTLSIILISLLLIHLPIESYYYSIKSELINELKLTNTHYFMNKIIHINKLHLLKFNLLDYYNNLIFFNNNIDNYITELKIKYDIPLRFISLIIISISSDNYLLIGLFSIFVAIVSSLNEWKYIKENIKLNKQLLLENKIRNYIINSKSYIINNEINNNYLLSSIDKSKNINNSISTINNQLDMSVNICIMIYILIIMGNNINNLSPTSFFYYFLLVYDIEYVGDKIIDYYKNKKIINKMQNRLNYLNDINVVYNINNNNTFNNIIITKIENNMPKLFGENIIINNNDHILVSGESGSGKTSLLYLLKGIITIDNISITPNLKLINSISYLTLSNHKNLYDDYLYNIVTNYDQNPDINLINKALVLSKINHKFINNNYVIIENLSTGERIRLIIARIIYIIIIKNYKILLFDEIDENLNNDLALEICNNIMSIFKDKIILYISHNEIVKQLFDKKMIIENGIINYQ